MGFNSGFKGLIYLRNLDQLAASLVIALLLLLRNLRNNLLIGTSSYLKILIIS